MAVRVAVRQANGLTVLSLHVSISEADGRPVLRPMSCAAKRRFLRAIGLMVRSMEGENQKMLIQLLKEVEKDGIVSRTVGPQVPPRVEYALSDMGIAPGPPMAEPIDWAFMRRAA
jgi:DNA-binding HxlR family transcriptional regulator